MLEAITNFWAMLDVADYDRWPELAAELQKHGLSDDHVYDIYMTEFNTH